MFAKVDFSYRELSFFLFQIVFNTHQKLSLQRLNPHHYSNIENGHGLRNGTHPFENDLLELNEIICVFKHEFLQIYFCTVALNLFF